jgi:thiol-disulfide isomerase/thioredoxin
MTFRALITVSALLTGLFWTAPLKAEIAWPRYQPGAIWPAPSRCAVSAGAAALRPNEAQYAICADQMAVFTDALADAAQAKKLLIVDFGATWCPWCKSLQAQFKSGSLADPTKFHVVEIALSTTSATGKREAVASGDAVLTLVLAQRPDVKLRAVPFLAVVDPARPTRTVARNLDDLESDASGQHVAPRIREFLTAAATSIEQGSAPPGEPSWLRKKWTRLWNRVWGL